MLRPWSVAIGVFGLFLASLACGDEKVRIVKSFSGDNHYVGQIAFNDRGDIAFVKSDRSDTELWYAPADQPPEKIAGTKLHLPGVDGEIKGLTIESVFMNDLGHVAFKGIVRSGAGVQGVWRYEPDGGLSLVCMEGAAVPGQPGKFFGAINLYGVASRPDSSVFLTSNPEDPRDVNARNPRWAFPPDLFGRSSTINIWQQSWHGRISQFGDGPVQGSAFVLNKLGDMVVVGHGQQGMVNLVSNGITIPVVTSGDSVSIDGSEHLIHVHFGASINRQKDVAFAATFNPHRTVILFFDRDKNELRPMLYAGQEIEGYPHAKMDINARVILNDIGNVLVYSSNHNDNESSVSTIFYCEKDKKPIALIKDGDKAPGTEVFFHGPTKEERNARIEEFRATREWADRANTSVPFSRVSFNRKNQAAFVGLLGGNVDATNDSGVWISDASDRTVDLVIRKGDVFAANNKTVKSIKLEGSLGGIGGGNHSLNDRGQLAYAVVFDDDSSAVVVDHRFASDALHESVIPKVAHVESGRKALSEWVQLADSQIEALRERAKKSDSSKLVALSERLRTEYKDAQLQLLALRKNTHDLDPITHYARVQQLERRLRELPEIWEALANWPFQKIATKTVAGGRKVAAEASRLLDEYGAFDEIREVVEAKNKELTEAKPKPLEFVERDVRDHARNNMFPFSSSRERLSIFDQGIGTLRPGVFPKPESGVRTPSVKVPDGPIVEIREYIGTLVKLRVTPAGRLAIDRAQWHADRAKTSRSEVYSAAHELLKESKVNEDLILDKRTRQFGLRMLQRNNSGGTSTAVLDAFLRFQELTQETLSGNGGSSSGGTGGGSSASRRFRLKGVFGAQIETDNDLIALRFNEMVGGKRSFSVRSVGDEQMRLMIESDESLFLFLQRANGSVRWIRDDGETSLIRNAESFSALYKQHPAEIESSFIDYLNVLGVIGPVKQSDEAFLSAVTIQLRRHSDVADTVDELLEQLDSSTFAERKAAFNELARNVLLYRGLLDEALKSDASFEVKSRLKELVDFANLQTGEYDILADVLGTLESPEQLKALREKSPVEHRAMYDEQLRLLEQ